MSAVRFTFDEDFEDSSGGTMSRSKIDDIRAAAYAEGVAAGQTEVLTSLEQSCESLLHNILTASQNLQERQAEQVSLMHKEAAKLAYAIIEKLAPALVRHTPLDEIELLVTQCLKNSPLHPRLVVRVDDSILPLLEEKLEKIRQTNSYQGEIILISETMAHPSDCRVEWANGGAERDFNSLLATIEGTVKLFIEAPESGPHHETSTIDPLTGTLSETINSE
ncbi:FliH/SctL family protein [Paremcibacter congregatus]|uniref:Uncharacterized protein n=1 Tax=Paremcibacter congregatus TaxID=2043170 RepID=A0A2G4YSE2_9PROT|nr:FliH/SctL family protein [Paremcibacter congregatus]PHZ85259.1 hypothetical protein CRD36_07590 [Paremcibacter congregatus]QDE27809.1 hypothetical protein FIV45_11245 [Paremcibacter congregatus]